MTGERLTSFGGNILELFSAQHQFSWPLRCFKVLFFSCQSKSFITEAWGSRQDAKKWTDCLNGNESVIVRLPDLLKQFWRFRGLALVFIFHLFIVYSANVYFEMDSVL